MSVSVGERTPFLSQTQSVDTSYALTAQAISPALQALTGAQSHDQAVATSGVLSSGEAADGSAASGSYTHEATVVSDIVSLSAHAASGPGQTAAAFDGGFSSIQSGGSFNQVSTSWGPQWGSGSPVSTPTTTTTNPVSLVESAFVGTGGQTINISSMFSVTASSANPTYLIVSALDRNEYPAGSTGATGHFSGNGATDALTAIDSSDGRGAGIVFTYNASTGKYYNSTYGYFDQLTYTSSTSANDVTNISVYTTNSQTLAAKYANDVYDLAQLDASGYGGSVTVATQASVTTTVPTQATPSSICSVALSFVGKAWNMDGCWTLASTIAAEAGASLPVDSTMVGQSASSNGEWIVAFDGTKQVGNWQSMVKAGEIVVIGTYSGTGHITTVVSGSGSTAMVVDNITYESSSGTILNSANDGSSSDVIVSAAHSATQEWAGVASSLVKIYELDTPIVSTLVSTDSLVSGTSQALSQLFTAADPASKSITKYQVYDTASTDSLTVSGAATSAHSASSAVTVGSLSQISLAAGTTACTDTVEVRACNGTYWGDWQSLDVSVVGVTTATTSAIHHSA
jgi:hypothetical protein